MATAELRRVVDSDGTTTRTETRTYDALGRAVRIERDGVVVDRIHAGPTVLREVSPCADRIWWPSEGLDQPAAYTLRWESSCLDSDTDFPEQLAAVDLSAVAWAANETALIAATGVTFFVLQDLRGDVVGLTDATGQLVETYDYDLFGARTVGDGSAVTQCTSTLAEACGSQYGNPLGYTGRPLSTVSGLYDMRARHYDPHLRQWTARDPLGYVDGFDVWGYVGGDPLNFVDPFGMQSAKPPGTQAGNTTGSEAEGPWGKPYERLKALGGPAGGRQGGRPNPRLIAQNGNGGGVGSGDATALTNAKTVLKRQINPSTEQDLFRKVSNSTDWTFLCEVAAAKGVVLPQCAPPSAPATPPVPSFGTPPDESEALQEWFDLDEALSAALGVPAEATSGGEDIGPVKSQGMIEQLTDAGYEPKEFRAVQYDATTAEGKTYIITVFQAESPVGTIYVGPHLSSANE